jgi:cell division protein FtsB
LIVCLLVKNTQHHFQIIEKDSQIEKLKQENLKYQYQIETLNEQWGVYSE